MTLGALIKERRKAAGLTQKQLAQKIGKAEITVRQYEKGGITPGLETKIAIANALNFPFDDYITDVDVENPHDDDENYVPTGEPVDEKEFMESMVNWMDDPAYIEKIAEEERQGSERGYYDVGTRRVGDRIVNELFYYPPSLSLEDLTEEEVKLLYDYRDFLIWKRKQKKTDNN